MIASNGENIWQTKWFNLQLNKKSNSLIELSLVSTNETLNTTLEVSYFSNGLVVNKLEESILDFDHAKIMLDTVLNLKTRCEAYNELPFALLPSKFTLYEVQNVFEKLFQKEYHTPNFRRDIAKYLEDTVETIVKDSFRPTKLSVHLALKSGLI